MIGLAASLPSAAAAAATSMLLAAAAAAAPERVVAPGEALQPIVDAAPKGAVLRLAAGRHAGPLRIARPLTLQGDPGALLAGDGRGSVVVVKAPDVRIEGIEITGSGTEVPEMDSGVLLMPEARRAQVRGNRLRGNLFGVYLQGAADSLVEGNTIVGRDDLRLAQSGDGIYLWNAPGARIVGNTISLGRDGIYVRVSSRNSFERNLMSRVRFAIHYMYTHDSRVVGNRSHDNHVAWAIMYSDRLEVRDNVSDGDVDHGLMLNTTADSVVSGNVVRRGQVKCAFFFNANRNQVRDNWFEGCPIGLHVTSGSEGNTIAGNAFVANRTQVKYVSTRLVDWGAAGRGNYWSDNPAFDLDGDGIADRPYRPNDVMDVVLWTLPAAKALINSPAVQVVRWAQARFPALYPGGLVDSAPLMRPAHTPPAAPG